MSDADCTPGREPRSIAASFPLSVTSHGNRRKAESRQQRLSRLCVLFDSLRYKYNA